MGFVILNEDEKEGMQLSQILLILQTRMEGPGYLFFPTVMSSTVY